MTMPIVASGLLLDTFPFVRVGDGPHNLLVIAGSEISNADRGWFTKQSFRIAFSRFAREHAVYIVNLKRNLPATYSTADMAADYARILREVIGPARVIGMSAGGLIAQHLALQAPELVERLVLAVSGARLSEEGRHAAVTWRDMAQSERWVDLYSSIGEAMLDGPAGKRMLRAAMRIVGPLVVPTPQYPQDFIVAMNADLAHDTTALLPALHVPTLVLGGGADPYFPAPLLDETAALIPGAQLKIYAGAGHGVVKMRKRQFEDDVLGFLVPAGQEHHSTTQGAPS